MADLPATSALRASRAELDAFIDALAVIEVPWIESAGGSGPFPDDAVWVGRSPPTAEDAPSGVLVLDTKQHAANVPSVTRLAGLLTDDALMSWKPWAQRPLPPQAVLDQVTLVVEDASPDSTWGIIVLLARVAGCDLGPAMATWLPPVEHWETKGTADHPSAEWPALASALAHSRFGRSPEQQDKDYQAAWTAVLRFAAECLRRGIDPRAIGDERDFPLLDEARTALGAEEQAYRDWLSHAHQLQLSLPVRHANARRLLVDALVFVEDEPTGAAKVLYRNDRAGSPLGHGFTFAASWRPSSPPGEDFNITLDPRRGVHLRELWEELERLETIAWEGRRPCWNPRGAEFGPANQPWFLHPEWTLVAAPRSVPDSEADGANLVPGSKLSWAQIQAAIWRVYNPLRGVMVTTLAGGIVPLLELPPESASSTAKTTRLGCWHVGTQQSGQETAVSARALSAAPIVDRVLAALAASGPSGWRGEMSTLPPLRSWSRVELTGGFALITAGGVLVLDDWREAAHPDMHTLRDVCLRSATLDQDLRRIEEEEIGPLATRFADHLKRPGTLSEQPGLAVQAARIAVRLAELRSHRPLLASADSVLLQDGLDKAWSLDRRLGAMEQQVRAVTDSLKSLGDAQMRRVTQLVALIGFPFYLATGLAKPLAVGALLWGERQGWWAAPMKDMQDPPTWAWWITFSAVFGASVLGAFVLQRRDSVRQ